MIFVANQLFNAHPQTIEQQFAACNGLGQSISEEFDRSAELQAQTLQLACESWSQYYSTLWQVKDPQEFFMLLSTQLHASAEQTQHYWHAAHSLTQQIQKKMFALEQTLSPMITESLIDITPAPDSTVLSLAPKLVTVLPKPATEPATISSTKAATKPATKQATKATAEIAKKAATATLVRAKTVPVKRSAKQEADSNIATVVASKAKAKSSTKPEAKSLQSAAVIASIEPATPVPVAKVKRVRTSTQGTQAVKVDPKTEADTMIPTKPPSKVRQVKKTETTEAAATTATTTATSSIKDDSTTKKSAVVGLPTKLASKPGFPGVAGQPGYKAKSSKATGAKKRVRQ